MSAVINGWTSWTQNCDGRDIGRDNMRKRLWKTCEFLQRQLPLISIILSHSLLIES